MSKRSRKVVMRYAGICPYCGQIFYGDLYDNGTTMDLFYNPGCIGKPITGMNLLLNLDNKVVPPKFTPKIFKCPMCDHEDVELNSLYFEADENISNDSANHLINTREFIKTYTKNSPDAYVQIKLNNDRNWEDFIIHDTDNSNMTKALRAYMYACKNFSDPRIDLPSLTIDHDWDTEMITLHIKFGYATQYIEFAKLMKEAYESY